MYSYFPTFSNERLLFFCASFVMGKTANYVYFSLNYCFQMGFEIVDRIYRCVWWSNSNTGKIQLAMLIGKKWGSEKQQENQFTIISGLELDHSLTHFAQNIYVRFSSESSVIAQHTSCESTFEIPSWISIFPSCRSLLVVTMDEWQFNFSYRRTNGNVWVQLSRFLVKFRVHTHFVAQ